MKEHPIMGILFSTYLIPDGVPYDGFVMKTIHPNNLCLQVIYYIMATFGLIFAGVCLVFNIVFRERK